jgi:phosphoglycerate dehydrogenase-like enzyme
MSQPLTICFYAVPRNKGVAAALKSEFSAAPNVQLFLPTSEAELLESPFFGHIDICLVLFTPPEVLNLVLTHNPVQWVHSFSAGVTRYITPEFAASRAPMTCSKGLVSEGLAEFAFAAMLHFAKHGDKLQANKEAKMWEFFEMNVLCGKTILILGYGNIGEAVGRIAKTAFQMRVIGVKRTPHPCNFAEAVFSLEALHTLLPSADVIVMCLPDTPTTHHVISTAELALMQTTAVLINLGRGQQLDESALITHLQANKIAGAALDVTDQEPLPTDNPLWDCPNLLLSPHCAGLFEGVEADAVEQFTEELEGFRQGRLEQSRRLVDREQGY